MGKIYGLAWMIQENEIKEFCFNRCKSILFAMAEDETIGPLGLCAREDCPHLDKQLDEATGELDGDDLFIRKLIDLQVIDNAKV